MFSTEPLPARTPTAESVTHVGSGAAESGTAGSFMTRPRTPISTAMHVSSVRQFSVERFHEDLVGGEPEVSDSAVLIAEKLLGLFSFLVAWYKRRAEPGFSFVGFSFTYVSRSH